MLIVILVADHDPWMTFEILCERGAGWWVGLSGMGGGGIKDREMGFITFQAFDIDLGSVR